MFIRRTAAVGPLPAVWSIREPGIWISEALTQADS